MIRTLTALMVLLSGSPVPGAGPQPGNPVLFEQYGAVRTDFDVAGRRGFVIVPQKPAADGSKPWLWYAPTLIGRYPNARHEWLFTRLLAAGFFIAGMDVGESWGNPEGRRLYTEFYETVVAHFGLSAKACLMPQSRGGLMLYNWAAEHPEWVLCVGGIYPVCNIGTSTISERVLAAYGMSESEMRARRRENSPLERLAGLAAQKIPILHLHGDADDVVPLESNSAELARRYAILGGKAEIVVINGKGHEEAPEFFESERLLQFFLSRGK
jgi:pimeloyl-ACP methyl ester carboxylesterase